MTPSPDFPFHDDEDAPEQLIDFYAEEVTNPIAQADLLRRWITDTISQHQAQLISVQYIFCSDDYLHQLNVTYLDHDTLTDIITFPYAEPPQVHGDLFISTQRVQDNAATLGHSFEQELYRVMIHGVLHLCGYEDKNPTAAQHMRTLEDAALAQLTQLLATHQP